MRKIILAFFITSGISFSVHAQMKITEDSEMYSQGAHNSLSVIIPATTADDVEKAFAKWLKDNDAKVTDKKGEIFGDNATIKQLGNNTLDFYAVVAQQDADTKLSVAVDLGGAFLSSEQHSDQYTTLSKMIYDFSVEQAKEGVQHQIDLAAKQFDQLQKEKGDLQKQRTNLDKTISDCEKSINDAKTAIDQNTKDQEAKATEIGKQQEVVDTLKKKKDEVK